MMDGSHNNQSINLQKEYITSSNIVSLFQKHGVPQHFDFMTVDLDLNTFWVLQVVQHQFSTQVPFIPSNMTCIVFYGPIRV